MESLSVKYRPTTFENVVGQDILCKVLKKQIATNNFGHSYLFCGPSGTGKTTLARIFARELNGNDFGTVELDAATHGDVDTIREIIDSAKTRSVMANYKVVIIDEAHSISQKAWQAFLKCIEECPEFTVFIFCTTEPEKVIKTVVNRCQVFNIKPVSSDKILDRLTFICNSESIPTNSEALAIISERSNGSVRQAITYLDNIKSVGLNVDNVNQVIGLPPYVNVVSMVISMLNKDITSALTKFEELKSCRPDKLVSEMQVAVIDMCKLLIFNDNINSHMPAYIVDIVKSNLSTTNIQTLSRFLDKVVDLSGRIKYDPNALLTIEAFIMGCLND